MKILLKVLAPAALLAAGLAVSTAEAAPAGSGLAPLKGAPEASSMAEETRWVRRCYHTRYGRVRCHNVWVAPRHHRRHRHHRHYRRW